MSDDWGNIRYTAAVAKVRGTYPHISDIADDVPIKTDVDYWKEKPFAKPYHPPTGCPINMLAGRPQSAPSQSQYHDSCQPKRPAYATAASNPPLTKAELRKADVVTQDTIWKQSVGKEQNGLQKWETTWGYLTEYDSKGNKIEREALPDGYQQYQTGPVPPTSGRQYGARLETSPAQTMLNLEYQLSKSNKRKKLDSEMVCY